MPKSVQFTKVIQTEIPNPIIPFPFP
jgi:hypothetical protein